MEATVKQANKITDMKARMSDIYLAVSWREIARTYFDKSVPWFQHKMYGIAVLNKSRRRAGGATILVLR